MPKLPDFPPYPDEWRPGNPFEMQPPIPRFLWNPWLNPEQRAELEMEYGRWAARRAEAMVPARAGFEAARRAAAQMSRTYLAGLPIELPPALPRVRVPRERKPRVPTIAEELASVVGVLTPEIREELIRDLQESWEIERKIPRRTEEKIEASRLVVDWAREKGVGVPGGRATEIVEEALARVAPART